VNSFQESLETAINRAIETRNIQGGILSPTKGEICPYTTLGIFNKPYPPITLKF
jgi:hypothetical protein